MTYLCLIQSCCIIYDFINNRVATVNRINCLRLQSLVLMNFRPKVCPCSNERIGSISIKVEQPNEPTLVVEGSVYIVGFEL